MRSTLIALILGLFLVAGCQTPSPTVHPDATADHDAIMLGQIGALVGDWEMPDEEGTRHHVATFAMTAGGSAVREIMFPGDAQEMTNLYHMDGGDLVITHYCAAGNQPRMVASKAVETDDGTVFHFKLESVSNLRESHDHYMGDMTLTILKAGGLRQDWRSYDHEGNLTDPVIFMLSRRN
jgi:hypothetical protein